MILVQLTECSVMGFWVLSECHNCKNMGAGAGDLSLVTVADFSCMWLLLSFWLPCLQAPSILSEPDPSTYCAFYKQIFILINIVLLRHHQSF